MCVNDAGTYTCEKKEASETTTSARELYYKSLRISRNTSAFLSAYDPCVGHTCAEDEECVPEPDDIFETFDTYTCVKKEQGEATEKRSKPCCFHIETAFFTAHGVCAEENRCAEDEVCVNDAGTYACEKKKEDGQWRGVTPEPSTVGPEWEAVVDSSTTTTSP